jgi:hypothetical protein
MTDPRNRIVAGDPGLQARIPGHGSFTVTAEAAFMIRAFGGALHCYQGPGGCRKQGLYFSRTEPKKHLRCTLTHPGSQEADGTGAAPAASGDRQEEITLSVSHELAPKLDGAILDFGSRDGTQRFAWLTLPSVKGPSCTCLRSIGPAAGKHAPCLDEKGIGLTDL